MRLIKARIQKYRSIRDTGFFEVEAAKTILVGPNEAGKSAILKALQQLNPPAGIKGFDALRDYPRSEYNDISTKAVKAADVAVVEGHFELEDLDRNLLPDAYAKSVYIRERRLDNKLFHRLENAPSRVTVGSLRKNLLRHAATADSKATADPTLGTANHAAQLNALLADWPDSHDLTEDEANALKKWLHTTLRFVHQGSEEESRFDDLIAACDAVAEREAVLRTLCDRTPVFVLFSNYFRVRPLIHLDQLATRIESNILDDNQFDYGNLCLLKLLGFTARQLSTLGKAPEPNQNDLAALERYRDQLDTRQYQLNAAEVRLTTDIRSVWLPDARRGEADSLRITADGQYLKVMVEDSLGVNIELDQRSEGFQWLVSFFVVFFAEAADKHRNAVLLLDEPGLSLHGLKQRDFRETITRLAEKNQTLYSTHSPFLVGPDELDLVRVIEMPDRSKGTVVHSNITSSDPGALLPLQEALGYDLAQSLFSQQRNLVLEGLTDFWYVDAMAHLLRDAGISDLNEKIALIPANSAGKLIYFATILHAHKLKVAALLDSDAAGDQAASQDTLVHTLGNKSILRTKDCYRGSAAKPEVEDLLRETLISIAKQDLKWDVEELANLQASRPIVDIFTAEIADFSKYRLAKAFLRWSRMNDASNLQSVERDQWKCLIDTINKVLK